MVVYVVSILPRTCLISPNSPALRCFSTFALRLCCVQPAWRHSDGDWVPAQANFTSLATPNEVGSGFTALVTLLHEGGHAAHFANIDQYSPFFSQV